MPTGGSAPAVEPLAIVQTPFTCGGSLDAERRPVRSRRGGGSREVGERACRRGARSGDRVRARAGPRGALRTGPRERGGSGTDLGATFRGRGHTRPRASGRGCAARRRPRPSPRVRGAPSGALPVRHARRDGCGVRRARRDARGRRDARRGLPSVRDLRGEGALRSHLPEPDEPEEGGAGRALRSPRQAPLRLPLARRPDDRHHGARARRGPRPRHRGRGHRRSRVVRDPFAPPHRVARRWSERRQARREPRAPRTRSLRGVRHRVLALLPEGRRHVRARRRRPRRHAAKDAPLWSLRYLDARTGYLAMPTWVTYATRWDWKEDLRRTFVDLAAKKATALVVDLRGNEGGEDVGNVILGHLLDRPLRTEGLVRWTRYRSVPDDLRASLHTLDKTFFDWGDAATPRGDGFYRLTRFDDEPGGDVLAPIAPRARLELVVLVDGSNSSAPSSSARSCRSTAWGGSSASPRAATSGASTAVPSSSWSSRPAGSSSISPSSRASRRTDAPMRFRTRGSSPTSSRGRPRRTSPRVVTWRSRRRAGSRRSDGLQLTASRAASAAPARVRVASPRMACSTSASIVPSRTFRHMTKSARSE
jgi:hypothetical protein